MASDGEASCESDPNFAVICAFMEKFGTTCGLRTIDFLELQEMLENTQEVHQELVDLHIKLLRKSRKTVSNERWEKAVIKFCHTFCIQDAWEIERFGYKKARLSSKLRVLKELLEMQFDFNTRFKAEINKMSAEELRSQPIGRDKQGHAYWFQNDNNYQIRVYKDDQDEETWTLVAKDRDGLASLISELSDGDSKFSSESAINEEDSNSLAEKPIIDTGQVDSSSDSNKKSTGDSENSNESSTKKEEDSNISAPGEADALSDEEEVEENQDSGEMDLTTSTKRSREEEDDSREATKMKIDEKIEVSEAIEEPLMLVTGEGNGVENKGVNPIVGEEIEEDLMFFCGAGNGEDCQTGNEDKPSDSQTKQSETSSERDTSDSGLVSISSESKNCVSDEVPTPPAVVKSPYKLGTIIDTKTDNKFFSSSTTVNKSLKKSRWDVEAIMAPPQESGRVKELVNKWEQQLEGKEEAPKKSMFFFGPGCLQFKPATVGFGQKVPPETNESDNQTDRKGDVGYRIEEDNKEVTSDCVQSGSAEPLDSQNEHQTPIDKLESESDNISAADVETKADREEAIASGPIVEETRQVQEESEKEISERKERIPEVTAALVGYKEDIEGSVKSSEEIQEIAHPQADPVPVVEEVCVKKHAYLLGTETSTESVENHQDFKTESNEVLSKETEQETETVIQNENVTLEPTLDLKSEAVEVEKVSKIDENENKQVIEQVPKGSGLEDDRNVETSDDRANEEVKSDNKDLIELSKTDDSADGSSPQLDTEVEVQNLTQHNLTEDIEMSKSDNKVDPAGSESGDIVETPLSKGTEIDRSKQDNAVGIEISKCQDKVGILMPNCDRVDISIPKQPNVTESIEVSKSNVEVSEKLSTSEDKVVLALPKRDERMEISKSKHDDAIESEVSKLEDKVDIELSDSDETGVVVENKDSVEITVSKQGDVENVEVSKCDDVVDTTVQKSFDKVEIEMSVDAKQKITSPEHNMEVSKSDDEEKPLDYSTEDVEMSESNDKVGVALPAKSDDATDAEVSKPDDMTEDVAVSKSGNKVDIVLPTEIGNFSENLTSKHDDQGAENLSKSREVIADPAILKSDEKIDLVSHPKFDDESDISVPKPVDYTEDAKILKSDDKLDVVSTKSDDAVEVTSPKCDQEAEVASSTQHDVSKDTEMSKLVDTDVSKSDEEKFAVKKDRNVEMVKGDEKAEAASSKGDEILEVVSLKYNDTSQIAVEKNVQAIGKVEITKCDKEADIGIAKSVEVAENMRVAACDQKGAEVQKIQEAKCTGKVEVLSKVPPSSQSDTTEQIEIAKSVNSVEVALPTCEDRVSKLDDNVRTDNEKLPDKIEQESIAVSKQEDLQTEVPEVLKSDQIQNKAQISSSDKVAVKSDEQDTLKLSNCDKPRKTSNFSKEIEGELSIAKNLVSLEESTVEKKSEAIKKPELSQQVVNQQETKDVTEKVKQPAEVIEETRKIIRESPKVIDKVESKPIGDPEKEKIATKVDDETVLKPVEKSAPKVSIREVRRHTRRSAQLAKTENLEQEKPLVAESAPATDPVRETIKVEAKKAPDKTEIMTREAVVYLKSEDKVKVDEKATQKEEPPKPPAKRGRKNNSSDQNPEDEKKPRVVATRRTTRSSKNAESVEETVEEKPPETLPAKPRRGRPRGSTKAKEEANEESSKKIKLSNDETPEVKRSLRSNLKVEEKEEPKDECQIKQKEDNENQTEQTQSQVKDEKAEEQEEKNIEIKKDEKLEMEEDVTVKNIEDVSSPDGSTHDVDPIDVESSNSSDVMDVTDKDPLTVEEAEQSKTENKPMSLSTFSLDFTESPTPTPVPTPPLTRRGLRKRGRESPQGEIEETAGKRPKMKAKRAVDVKLRKSIEEQKKKDLTSSDDDSKGEQLDEKSKKKHHKKTDESKNAESLMVSSDAEKGAEPSKKKSRKNKNMRLLSNLGIDPENAFGLQLEQTGVRQSRRIAQLKIREEAERRKLEDEITNDSNEPHKKKKKSKKSKDKDYKVEKKKPKDEAEDEEVAEEDSTDSKEKRRKMKKRMRRLFDERNPWRSSSDSSSSNEEEEIGEEEEEEDEDVLQYVSDHEFSPESDMEGDAEAQPLKRARTARKESDVEEVDDCPCHKCNKSDHPEWILLCDSCDNGWHCSCLRPPLLVIPEGDWFCPPCQHTSLLTNLRGKLNEYDKKLSKKEIEDRRKQRLAYVGISLNSVLPTKDTENIKKRMRPMRDDDDDDDGGDASSEESDSESATDSESGSDSDEPIYQLRQRRQAHSYRFNDFDDLINSAIQDEMDAVKGAGNQGRGKDIATIVNAEKEEERKKEAEKEKEAQTEGVVDYESLPPVVPVNDKDKEAKPIFETDEVIQVKKKIIGRKKHRKLNALDISSADDDEDSDEDFKGTSSESEDDFDEDLGSEDSDDLDNGRGRRKGSDPVRRSTRARTSRFDADFIDDGDSYSDVDAPRRKKKRSIWDDSESEESDRSWGRRKRKPLNRSKKSTSSTTTKKKKSKKKKKRQDSDEEVYKKKKPKIKFGLDGDDDGPVRRTRGKKITYVDALGSDTDEDRVKRPPPRIDSDEEYVAEDDIGEDEKLSEAESGEDNSKVPKIQIQSYTDARFTQLLPEPKNLLPEDLEGELNPIDQINRNVEMMDENEMEKMMEEEEYANKQLQMVAQQLEKEKRRKEREAKKLEGVMQPGPMSLLHQDQKKRMRKPKDHFQFSGPIQEPLVGNVDNLLLNSENNDELSEPPGVSLPLFAELGGPGEGLEDPLKKRRGKTKKSLEEAVANLGSARQHDVPPFLAMSNKNHPTDLSMSQESNIEIAAPPQPFSQSQPTPSVITRMLQSKPGQTGYPVGTIRPKQFATMAADDDHSMASSPAGTHTGQYVQGTAGMRPQLSSPYRQMAPSINHFSRTAPPPQMRTPVPHLYHSHRPMDPSPSGGGAINMADHNSPGRVVSPAASSPGSNKNETPPPPYSRPPPGAGPPTRFPMSSPGSRHIQQMVHLQPNRPNLSPYHPGMPPQYHYGQFGQEDALPPGMYQGSPYSEAGFEGQLNPSENSNSKGFEDESGGEFGGLVSYFSSQREDDLES